VEMFPFIAIESQNEITLSQLFS